MKRLCARLPYLLVVAVDDIVEGPAWTSPGLDDGAGRYPLQVERVVGRLVGSLLPGIITTTRHARMYSLHALAWAEAEERELAPANAAELVRRCEVVLAAIYRNHAAHRVLLASAAHGEGRVDRFVADGVFDVAAAAQPKSGLSEIGFRDVYTGPAAQVGLLSPGDPPSRGPRADIDALRAGLGGLLSLAERDRIPLAELAAAGDELCLCAAGAAKDGALLRRILFEAPEADRVDDRSRQLSAHMLLQALAESPAADAQAAFCAYWGFGDPLDRLGGDHVAEVACGWRAAILRNHSVGAWRSLWRWLAEQLRERPMMVEELGAVFADELGQISVAELQTRLPVRRGGSRLLPAELEIAAEPWSPLVSLRLLALGALRIDDLDERTTGLFLGTVPHDLGPRWVEQRLREWRSDEVANLAHELVSILVNRAKRVALSRMELRGGMPRIRSRLRDRDGLLSVHGEEGAGEVALRISALTEILIALGSLDRLNDGIVVVTQAGRELLERTA
jgi:hypothetical protein